MTLCTSLSSILGFGGTDFCSNRFSLTLPPAYHLRFGLCRLESSTYDSSVCFRLSFLYALSTLTSSYLPQQRLRDRIPIYPILLFLLAQDQRSRAGNRNRRCHRNHRLHHRVDDAYSRSSICWCLRRCYRNLFGEL